jgi:putative transposase
MPRKPRELVDHGVYHVIQRGNHRKSVFEEDRDYLYFIDLLRKLNAKYPFFLFHYCLMPNHIHLMLEMALGLDLPKLGHGLFRGYAKWRQSERHLTGHLWQGRFKSPRVARESYFLELGRYIERNPVRANLVKRPEDYRWSSYRYYALGEANNLVTRDPYYDLLGKADEERRRNYRSNLEMDFPHDRMLDEALVEKACWV